MLIAYTYAGDANLSGFIDADDYFHIDAGYNNPADARSYVTGDFNYDGVVNSDDYFIIDANFSAQGAPMTGAAIAGATTVPEPGGAAIAFIAAAYFSSNRIFASRAKRSSSTRKPKPGAPG